MKKIALVLGLVLAFSMVSVASAATVAELQAQLAALTAQIAAMGGSTASVSSAPSITKSLTIGSKGDEVTALQKYLEDEGLLVMPAGVDYGYFGALTKKSVIAWQKANDVSPASGYFGPLSRAKLAGLVTTAPVGGVTTPVVGLDQKDGSVTVAINTSPANATVVKKGETKDVISYNFKATAGNVSVSRIDFRFDTRAWLYFNKADLVDGSGNVVATKNLTSSDFTEITANTSYMMRMENVNFVVVPGADKDLTLRLTAAPSSDRTATTITVTSPAGSIRTINGKGFTDSLGDVTLSRTISYQAASTGNLIISLDSTTPTAGIVGVSQSSETVAPLAVISVRAENNDVTLNSLAVKLTATANLVTALDLYKGDVKIASADQVTGTSTFSDLNLTVTPGTQNIAKLVVKARLAGQGTSPIYADGATAYITVDPDGVGTVPTNSSVSATDALFNTATVSGSTFNSYVQTVYYKSVGFAKLSVNGLTALRNSTTQALTTYNDPTKDYVTFRVTAGDYDTYLLKGGIATTSATAATSTPNYGVIFSTNATTTTSVVVDHLAGSTYNSSEDGTYTYKVPAGQSRDFIAKIGMNTSGLAAATAANVTGQVIGFGWALSDTISGTLYSSNMTDYKFQSSAFAY